MGQPRLIHLLLAILTPVLLPAVSLGDVRYVRADLHTGADDGSSWNNAYRGRDALARAIYNSLEGDEFWVAAGTYTPSIPANRGATIAIRSRMTVLGGFSGKETSRDQRDPVAHITILSGDIAGNDPVLTDNSYHVVHMNFTSDATLDGFTITAGNASGGSGAGLHQGAGLLINAGSNLLIRRCRFIGNRATAFGAGAAIYTCTSSSFQDCTWEDNTAAGFVNGAAGGAVFLQGGSEIAFTRCVFRSNHSNVGGAMRARLASPLTFDSCVFWNNTATASFNGWGGALTLDGGLTSPVIFLRSCTFVGNSCDRDGGAISSSASTQMDNCAVWGNTSTQGISQVSFSVAASWSLIQGGAPGEGNIDADPRFANAAIGDLRPLPGSPLIDAGNSTLVTPGTSIDLDGLPRFVDDPATPDTGKGSPPIIDIGAYEYQGAPACPADWDGSGGVDSRDFFAFLADFFAFNADFNHSGQTNSQDFFDFLAAFFTPC